MKIAIIGVGNLGYSIALGVLGESQINFKSLYLSKRNTKTLNSFENFPKVTITCDNKEAVKNSDIVILAVQPGQLEPILKTVYDAIDPSRHTIISVIAGRSIEQIEKSLPANVAIIRSMPNTAISVSQSMTCLSANTKGEKNIDSAKAIFNCLGSTKYIEEHLMQAATVICASGIAFWLRLIRASAQGAIQLGFEADVAQELSMQTAFGAATLLMKSQGHPEQEFHKVTTPGGCTIAGLNEMENKGMSKAFIKGLIQSYEKINELKSSFGSSQLRSVTNS
jgi:pyrroline-5-carboxylate reductase